MLKKFFISMLGSMAAIWLSFTLLCGALIAGCTSLLVKNLDTKSISGSSVLYIDLSGTIAERADDMSFTDMLLSIDDPSEDLVSIISAIRLAADDKDIKGIYINCGGSSLGIASRGEIIQALKDFKKTDKWIFAYADEFSQGDYYIASVADKVFLNPVGSLDVRGLASEVMFYKNLLDKIGVKVNVVRVGTYKSAVEPYMTTEMSPASREQTTVFLNQIWDVIRGEIAENRDLKSDSIINQWADQLSVTWNPERYVDCKAITQLCYRVEVENMIREKTNTMLTDELPVITPSDYLLAKGFDSTKGKSGKHVAVLFAVGEIYTSGESGIVSETMVPLIYELADNDDVKGMVLRVNSPGGSAFASEQIWRALEDFKDKGKPLYVSMGDYAASGGYYISCGADSIFCDKTTLTGSIGIFGLIPNAEELITKKIGLGVNTVSTNPNASFPSLFENPTQTQLDSMQAYVSRGYETFTSRVAQGRHISQDSVKVIGGGRVWDGVSAYSIGLVDAYGSLFDVIAAMTAKTGLDKDEYAFYPTSDLTALQTLLKSSKKSIEINIEGVTPEETRQISVIIDRLRRTEPMQARMETLYIK